MLSERAKIAVSREWRELGFYYERDDGERRWRIVGDRIGIKRFSDLVREYASNDANEGISEHEHYGPYMYLEIGTWRVPEITDHWIAGPLIDLLFLASEIEKCSEVMGIGTKTSLRDIFSPNSKYDVEIEMKASPFQPDKEDPELI